MGKNAATTEPEHGNIEVTGARVQNPEHTDVRMLQKTFVSLIF